MKRILIILIVLALSLPVFAQEKEDIFFGGVNKIDEVTMIIGVGIPLGSNLWSFNYATIGEYGSISTELGYMLGGEGFYVAPLAGFNADWFEFEEDEPIMTYIVGAGGLVAGLDFTDRLGLWAYGKYKFKLEKEIMYQDGYAWGGGLFLRF